MGGMSYVSLMGEGPGASVHCGDPLCDTCNSLFPSTPPTPVEVMVTDPNTGGKKASKASQLSTIDPLPLAELGKVGGMGAQKYDRYNYLKGYRWSLSYDALQRHLGAFWAREDNDPESGLSHLAHAAWHCLALLSFVLRGLGTDDRPPAK